MGLRDSISKGFSKANDFVNEQQRRARLKESLESEKVRLTSLFTELGKITFNGKPYIDGRTSQVVIDEIKSCQNAIESIQLQLSTPVEI